MNSPLSGTWQYPEHSLCETGEPPPCLQPVLFHKSKVEYWNIWQKQTKERKKPLCWQKGVATFLGHIADLSLVECIRLLHRSSLLEQIKKQVFTRGSNQILHVLMEGVLVDVNSLSFWFPEGFFLPRPPKEKAIHWADQIPGSWKEFKDRLGFSWIVGRWPVQKMTSPVEQWNYFQIYGSVFVNLRIRFLFWFFFGIRNSRAWTGLDCRVVTRPAKIISHLTK